MQRNWRVYPWMLIAILVLGLALTACQTETTPSAPAPVTATTAAQQSEQQEEQAPAETPVEDPAEEPTAEPAAGDAAAEPPAETPLPPSETPEPTAVPATDAPDVDETEEAAGPQALPAEPQEIIFQAEDGQELIGRYYPAAVNPAPVVVLMHWAGGDQNDWNEIAFWLQNRGLGGSSPNVGSQPWLDPSWFPEVFEDYSYAVFTFTFRDCDGGCKNFNTNRSLWLLDAVAAVETAGQLEGVDPARVVAMGASIGADGAIDGCFYPGGEENVRCQSALSLSPGSYLTVVYADAVPWGDQAGKPVLCYYSAADGPSALACISASGDLYDTFEWPGDAHGMLLLTPDTDPSAMQKILDWLGVVFES